MTCLLRRTVLVAAAALLLLGGCGLKGPLALPEKSERVIIRGPQAGTPAPAPAAPAEEAPPAPSTDSPPKTLPAEEPPPPPLPGGNPGALRGG
jgi:predicted small lipoprotein YifL